VDLAHVYGETCDSLAHVLDHVRQSPTSCGVESSAASVAFEVFRLLMINQYFLVVEISLAVVAPWPAENLVDVWMTTLLLAHPECWKTVYRY
jgi:hypothetical protein